MPDAKDSNGDSENRQLVSGHEVLVVLQQKERRDGFERERIGSVHLIARGTGVSGEKVGHAGQERAHGAGDARSSKVHGFHSSIALSHSRRLRRSDFDAS